MIDQIAQRWVNGEISDNIFLSTIDKLKNSKRKNNVLVINGSNLTHYVDYKQYMDSGYHIMTINQGYLLPYAEEFTYFFNGDLRYVDKLMNCSTFSIFCKKFKGYHVFTVTTSKCKNPMYGITRADVVKAFIKKHNIQKFIIVTHCMGDEIRRRGYAYVPPLSQWSPSSLPYGYGGTMGALTIPLLMQLGYSSIVITGIGVYDNRHFYGNDYIYNISTPKSGSSNKNLLISRWLALKRACEQNGIKLIVIPKMEPEIAGIFNEQVRDNN